jgi:NAD(P)-dependent dehydrogenase (short-subunit alcohol dehydrogenase family)
MSAPTARFDGQVVLVTGASRGIGAAMAKAFAREGALVLVNYLHNAAAAQEVVMACEQAGGQAWACKPMCARLRPCKPWWPKRWPRPDASMRW